jgi:hypothetical protein
VDDLLAFLQSDNICPVCRKERKTNFFKDEKVSMCLACYAKKLFKDLEPGEIEYIEYAVNTGGELYKLNKVAKWYRKFYKDILWNGKD